MSRFGWILLLCVIVLAGHASAQVVDLFNAIFEEAGISTDLKAQPKDDFKPAASARKVAVCDDELLAGRIAIATLMTAGQRHAASKRAIEEEEAVRNNDFLAFLLGKETAAQLRGKQQYDDFMTAHKVHVQDCKDAAVWDEHVGRIMRRGMGIPDAGRTPPRRTVRRQPQPKKPVQRQNDAYRELNNRLIAACNANNMDSASQIYNEMQRRGIPVAPEARQAMDAFVDREVDRMVDPLRQSLGGMR